MTIVASGEISLGGNATATRSVACELGRSGTAAICMDETTVRSLASRTAAASAICMNDFYGKSNVPTVAGQFFGGGYYIGIVGGAGQPANYYLIVAPNASGCACCKWRTDTTLTGNCINPTCNCNNGYWNTYTYLCSAAHPAGNWTRTRSINGFSDWYLPAKNELNVLYTNKGTPPAGEQFVSNLYWSSSEDFTSLACLQNFDVGGVSGGNKTGYFCLRAVRRESFTPSAPTALGQAFMGGYYIGIVGGAGQPANYYLIIAPNASGCACCQWRTDTTLTGNCSNPTCNLNNGYWNTYTYLCSAAHPAGNWTRTRSINGFSDWYLPAINELNVLYTNKGTPPAGEQFAIARYWSASESGGGISSSHAYNLNFNGGFPGDYDKPCYHRLRAIRRESFTPSAPTALGQAFMGGYYIGTITSPANYYLIIAPNASGCACCKWRTDTTLTGNCINPTCNCNNGYWNTYTYLCNDTHPAGNWTRTRSINGFSDWYLPALNELNVLYTNKGTPPAGEQFASNFYWSSSEHSTTSACSQNFTNGFIDSNPKTSYYRLRAVRRQPF